MDRALNVKLPENTIIKLKMHCAERQLTIQTVTDCAITTYLERYENLRDYGTQHNTSTMALRRAPGGQALA